MNFKNWLLSEEIFPNKTATVYHRTQSLDDISNILSKGFSAGDQGGCMYGCGLYTTFDLKSQFTNYMERYGNYIIKFKVTNLENYLITPLNVAKYILGKDYKITDQFKKKNPSLHWGHEEYLGDFDNLQSTEYSSDFFKKIYDHYGESLILKKFAGVIYRGRQDGYCLVKYEPVNDSTITMLGYAYTPILPGDQPRIDKINQLLNNQGWETSTDKEKIKSIWQRPVEKRPKVELEDDFLKLKDLILNNKFFRFKKALENYPNLNSKQFYEIIKVTEFKDRSKVLKMLMQHQEVSGLNVMDILDYASSLNSIGISPVKELAETLGSDNIEKLNGEDIDRLLNNSEDVDLQDKIEVLIKYKKNLDQRAITSLVYHAKDKKQIVGLLGKQRIETIPDYEIFELLKIPSKARFLNENSLKEMAEALGMENINRLSPTFVTRLIKMTASSLVDEKDVQTQRTIYIFKKIKEMLEILGSENIKKLTKDNIEDITSELSEDNKIRVKKEINEHKH